MLINFLIKKGFITVVPIEKSFFISVDFSSDTKLSYASVLFNYQNLSPYKNGSVSYIQKEGKLLLWFYDAVYRKVFTVPEGFFFYHFFMKEKSNRLVSIESKSLFVIENGLLVYQSSCTPSLCEDEALLIKKYQIEDVVKETSTWYAKNSAKIINRPLYVLMRYFLDKELLVAKIKEKASLALIPVAIFLGVLTGVQFAIQNYLHKELAELSQQKEKTKQRVKGIFQQIRENKTEVLTIKQSLQKYNTFNSKILVDLAEVLKLFQGRMYYYTQNQSSVTLRMECTNIEDFLSELSRRSSVHSYKLTRQVNKGAANDITLEIELNRRENSE